MWEITYINNENNKKSALLLYVYNHCLILYGYDFYYYINIVHRINRIKHVTS